ncbi:hypothetical protein I79_023485 [Cricetulus griseus]|uniref:Uncharacterized protein n=1 Tax=Cricetulus griseus TaxID=10029 RepID=G3II24_CRIGR|nr:hypothetical protein I79_023485 [Cricetulus griseus]
MPTDYGGFVVNKDPLTLIPPYESCGREVSVASGTNTPGGKCEALLQNSLSAVGGEWIGQE